MMSRRPTTPIYLSGIQALAHLPMLQRQRDAAAGPEHGRVRLGLSRLALGNLDQALWKARSTLEEHHVHFQPGVNEELAATAVWGSQQVGLFPGAKYDGVFGMWYGKGPGVDRSMDVLKHANAAGTARHGGVLAMAGDDHGAKSSSIPHQSEHMFAPAMIPVLNPAGVQEYLDFGMHGWAMSRYAGCWVAMRATADTVESSASVMSIRTGSSRCCPRTSRCRRAGSASAGPTSRLSRSSGCSGTKSTPRWRMRGATSSTARHRQSESALRDHHRRASPTSTSGRLWMRSASTRQRAAEIGICGSTRSA